MSSQDKKIENAPSSQTNLQEEKIKNPKKNSQNKKGSSSNTQKMDIWHRNEMEKHRKMMEQNQKRMKQNTLKEKNEQNKAEIEQQEQLEKIKKEKREQYEKYLRTNLRQNEDNYQKQKPKANVIQYYDDQDDKFNSKENFDNADNSKKGLKQWVPRPVPLENADKFLQEQKIEKELYENQMKQVELQKLLEEKKMLDMYKNIPKPKNMKNNNLSIGEEGENDNNSFGIEDSQNLYIDSENESQVRKKRKKNENTQQKKSYSQQPTNNNEKKNNSNNQYQYNYEQQISVVQDQYDLYGDDRGKTPDMLGFDSYNKNIFVKEKNSPKAKKKDQEQKKNQKDKNSFDENYNKGNKFSNSNQDNKQNDISKKQSIQNQRKFEEENDDLYGNEDNNYDNENTFKQSFVQKVLPNGMTNHHKEIGLSKGFQKIKFEYEGDDGEESPTSQKPSTSQSKKSQILENQKNKIIQERQIQSQYKQQNMTSEFKRQLDQKEADSLKIKQEQLIKEKKLQRQKEEELQKQFQNKQKSPEKQNDINQIENKKRDSYLQEFKQQFNDLKKEYNYHRQQSKTNIPTQSNENSSSQIETESKKNKNSSQQKGRYKETNSQQSIPVKTPFTEQDDDNQFLEQADYDKEIKNESLSQSGHVVRRTNYLKDVSKFSMKQQPVIEKPSYSKNMKERRKFWERKTNEDFLNQSIEEKATITAISKFKSKLQQNINFDKQYNNEKKQGQQESPNNQKQKEMQEWSKLNEQEIKLQRELFQMHFETLDKVKEVEEKNNISLTQNLSQNLGHQKSEQKSRINTATSNKSNVTNKTQKTTAHKEASHGKNKSKQINPISEIENEDDIEASIMNIDNKLSDQKNRILLMTAEIEQSQKPKNPVLRKELIKNPQILQQNPFTFDITSADKEYLEEEKLKFLSPAANSNHQKSSRLNISHISHVSNSKELNSQNLNNRPNSNKTNITSNQISSLAKITPTNAAQPINSHSQVSLVSQQDKLPRISLQNPNLKDISDSDKIGADNLKQRDTTSSSSQISKYPQKQNSNISQTQSTHNQQKGLNQQSQQNMNLGQNQQSIAQKKQIESKNNIKIKEQELRKKFPEFFADEESSDQVATTPVIKNKTKEQGNVSTKVNEKQINYHDMEEKEDEQSVNGIQSIQNYNSQQPQSQASKRQESSKSFKKKQLIQQAAPVNPEVVENDKEDLKLWWKQVQKSIEKSNENTPSQRIGEEKSNISALSQENKISPQQKNTKQEQVSLPVLPSYEKQQVKEAEAFKAPGNVSSKHEQQKRIDRFAEQRQGSQTHLEDNNQNIVEQQEDRKKALIKKFMDECDQDEQQQIQKDQQEQRNQNQQKQGNHNLNKQNKQADPNRKQLISIEFDDLNQQKNENKQQKFTKNNVLDENKMTNNQTSIMQKQNRDEPQKNNNNQKQLRNYSGNNKSSESLSKNQSNVSSSSKLRQKSAEDIPDSRNQLKNNMNKENSNQSSPHGQSKKRVEQVLDKKLIAKVEYSQQQIEKTIQETLERIEQAEKQQLSQEQDKKVNLTKRKSDPQSHHPGAHNYDKELSEISQNQSFAESDFSVLTGNGNYAVRQVIKKNYIITGKVPSKFNHDNLYPKNKSQNNSFHDGASNLSSSKIYQGQDNNNIQNKGGVSDKRDVIDEEEYQGDIKINRNVNLQKLLFVE